MCEVHFFKKYRPPGMMALCLKCIADKVVGVIVNV